MPLTLYSVSDGPPSLAVRQALHYLKLEHKLINVDFGLGEHMTEEYAQKNPQKEIPVIDDDGFFLGERPQNIRRIRSRSRQPDLLIRKLFLPRSVNLTYYVAERECFVHSLSLLNGVLNSASINQIWTDHHDVTGRGIGDKKIGRQWSELFKRILANSNAILQYLAEKYGRDDTLYPKNPQARAIVNHRLCFNLSTYYRYISEHVALSLACRIAKIRAANLPVDNLKSNLTTMAPIFFDYQRTPLSLKKTQIALDNFNKYLKLLGTKYAAGDNVTIADFQLVTATMCLEAINFDISPYPLVEKWYVTYKREYPELWKIVEGGMKEIAQFENNPPDLSHMDHPIHPIRRK